MTLKDRYGFGGFSGTPPSEPNLSTPPPPPPPGIYVTCHSTSKGIGHYSQYNLCYTLTFLLGRGLLDVGMNSFLLSAVSPSEAEPKTPALSEEHVAQCKTDLISSYKKHKCLADVHDSAINFEDIFTNLTVGPPRFVPNESLYRFTDLFSIDNSWGIQKRVMVVGESGAGKTALCAKIICAWMNGEAFQQFALVVLVPPADAHEKTIGAVAKTYLSDSNPLNPVTADKLNEYSRENPDKVLIICDDFDHCNWQFNEDSPSSSESESRAKTSRSDDLNIINILSSDPLETCSVLVTCNPEKKNQTDLFFGKVYAVVVWVGGFRKENIYEYIHNYFKNYEQRANTCSLIQTIKENNVLEESLYLKCMSWTPTYVRLLCLMWEVMDIHKREKIKIQTFSQFLKEIFHFLKEDFVEKKYENADDRRQLRERLRQDFVKINKIAYDLCDERDRNNTTSIEQHFESCQESMKTAIEIGILTEEKSHISWEKRGISIQTHKKCNISFTHQLFQDYMAGEVFGVIIY